MVKKAEKTKTAKKTATKGIASVRVASPAANLKAKKTEKIAKDKKTKKTIKKVSKKTLLFTNIELTDKEELFCREYVCDAALNATRAYMSVYPDASYNTAKRKSCELRTKGHIKARIEEMLLDRAKRLEVTPERILAELAKLAFYDPRKFFDANGRVLSIQEMDADVAAVIGGIETFHKITGDNQDELAVVTKIKLPDKKAALEKLGQNHNLWKEVGSKENPLVVNRIELVAL